MTRQFDMTTIFIIASTEQIARELVEERLGAHKKHQSHSMEAWPALSPNRLPILLEELGEVAKEFNEAQVEGRDVDLARLRAELIQVAAMAVAWASVL